MNQEKEEIGKLFGGIHYSAVTKASMRLKEEMTDNRRLSKLVLSLDSQFKTLYPLLPESIFNDDFFDLYASSPLKR